MKALQLDSKRLQQFEKLSPVFVFVIALGVRLYYDLVVSQQRLCSFGDGYFFLKTGQELAKAITSAASFPEFLTKLTVHTSEVAGSVATFGSGVLADRLLLDGPVYTCFLAIVHILTGIVGTADYAQNSNIFSIANSIVDAMSCVLIYCCGRLAFSRKAGLIAALLLAIYPAAILNTRMCYSELFTYFLLLLWTTLSLCLLRLKNTDKTVSKTLLSFSIGAASILLVLARSVFFPLPIAALAILFVPKLSAWKVKEQFSLIAIVRTLAAMIVGGALIMAPWLWFTHQVTGKFVPWVNRAPGYNLFVGNQLNTDGWRTWPAQPGIPNETSDAVKSISKNFSCDPARFSALILRKEFRLWAGVWNDFKHKFFGLNWQTQNVFHDLILLFSFVGFTLAVREPGATRRSAIIFGMFAAYHAVYACFEPVARYAITAMPFAVLLAAYAISTTPSPCRNRNFLALILFGSLYFTLVNSLSSLVPLCVSILPVEKTLVASVISFLWVSGVFLLARFVCKLIPSPRRWQCNFVMFAGALPLVLINLLVFFFDPAATEWFTELKAPNDTARAEISILPIPDNVAPVSYLLVDLRTSVSSPMVEASVNGVPTAPPLPVLQLMDDRNDAADIFSLQAQAMGVDPRSFRHWWVFPLATKDISMSGINKISISFKPVDGTVTPPVKLYGDYPDSVNCFRSKQVADSIYIPSINKFSWVKGFVTIDRRDPRPYEEMKVHRTIKNCSFRNAQGDNVSDLSTAMGRQFGTYRMFLYLPPKATPSLPLEGAITDEKILFESKEERIVAGGDPSTMLLNREPVKIPKGSESAFYMVNCELQSMKRAAIGGISVKFRNDRSANQDVEKQEKKAASWSSPWSPTTLEIADRGWQKFSFLSRIPAEISKRSDTTAAIMVSPFSADRLFLHHKDALRDKVKVRNVELKYFPQLAPKFSFLEGDRLF